MSSDTLESLTHTHIVLSHLFLFLFSLFLAGKPAIGGPWTLVDLQGNLVTHKQLQGKWILLYFG